MGKAKRQAQVCSSSSSCDSSSSSDFSDDERPSLDAGRYQAADLQQGLRTRQFRLWAVRELHQVLAQGWSSAGKKLQAAVFGDLMVAVQQPDSRPAVVEATAALLAVAKRVLPQQKRNQLVKQQRSAAVAASRASRKHADAGPAGPAAAWCEADDDDELLVVLGDVPAEVVRGILQALDPLSLAAAACVCRVWRELATDSSLWQQHLQHIFPGASQQQQRRCRRRQQQQQQQHSPGAATGTDSSSVAGVCSLHKQFAAAAQRHPSALLPWRSCRVLVGGRLQWMAPGAAAGGAPSAVAKAARRGVILPGPVYVTTAQAVSWLMGSSWSQVFAAGSNSDSSSSSDGSSAAGSSDESDGEESHTLAGRRAAANALRLWAISKP